MLKTHEIRYIQSVKKPGKDYIYFPVEDLLITEERVIMYSERKHLLASDPTKTDQIFKDVNAHFFPK